MKKTQVKQDELETFLTVSEDLAVKGLAEQNLDAANAERNLDAANAKRREKKRKKSNDKRVEGTLNARDGVGANAQDKEHQEQEEDEIRDLKTENLMMNNRRKENMG